MQHTFADFFGPCVLNQSLSEYDISTRLRIETAVHAVHNLAALQSKYKNDNDVLIMEVIETIGSFAEHQEMKPVDDVDGISGTVLSAINALLFVETYTTSTKRRVHERYHALRVARVQLAELRRIYGFTNGDNDESNNNDEVGNDDWEKVVRFVELLDETETSVAVASESVFAETVESLLTEFSETHDKVVRKLDELASHVDRGTGDVETVMKLHTKTVEVLEKLESIHALAGREFAKKKLVREIGEEKSGIQFVVDMNKKRNEWLKWIDTEERDVSSIIDTINTNTSTMDLIPTLYSQFSCKPNRIRTVFDHHDTAHKGYLTKTEFADAFRTLYPNAEQLSGSDEINTIFETNYETMRKVRRGMEFKQFETIVKLGYKEPTIPVKHSKRKLSKPKHLTELTIPTVTKDTFDDCHISITTRRKLNKLVADKSQYNQFFANLNTAVQDSGVVEAEVESVVSLITALEPFTLLDD